MSKGLRAAFGAMARGNARRYQMSQKAPKEKIPALLAELVNRQSNLKTIELIDRFLATVHVAGAVAVSDLGRCFSWLTGVSQGEAMRVKELRELLPDTNTEIKLGPEEPADKPAPAAEPDSEEPAVASDLSVGAVELQKGAPVFEQA